MLKANAHSNQAMLRKLAIHCLLAIPVISTPILTACTRQPLQSSGGTEDIAIRRISALGRIEPQGMVRRITSPASLSNDRIERLLVREGENVKAGQELAFLSSKAVLRASLNLAEQRLELAKIQLDNVTAGPSPKAISSQEAIVQSLKAQRTKAEETLNRQIEQAKSRASTSEIEFKRYQMLYEQGGTTDLERNRYRKESEQAQARVNELLAQKGGSESRLDAEIKAAESRVAELKNVRPEDILESKQRVITETAARNKAEEEFNESVVRAPENGQILQIFARPGERIGEKGILKMADTDDMIVTAEVYQTDLGLLKIGQKATVTAPGLKDGSVRATLTKILPQVQRQATFSGNPGENMDLRVFNVRLQLHPSPEQRKRLRFGTNMQVQVIFDASNPQDGDNK